MPILDRAPGVTRQALLFDADDTLWENNIYFEEAIASFISYLDHRVHTPEEVRAHLNACERATIAAHGYGVRSFRRSLTRCFEELTTQPLTEEHDGSIAAFSESIAAREIELLPGVEATLSKLAERHRLFLVTKGDREEQTGKLQRSGLERFFSAVEVPVEKHAAMYRDLVERHDLDPANTWMIGNSPRSDINPALAAGLHAVYLPHFSTWALELEMLGPVPGGQRFLELSRFAQLLEFF